MAVHGGDLQNQATVLGFTPRFWRWLSLPLQGHPLAQGPGALQVREKEPTVMFCFGLSLPCNVLNDQSLNAKNWQLFCI